MTQDDKMAVAKTILQQLGGNKFIAMTGARNFLGSENSLSFRFPGHGKANYCRITLTPMDTYKVEFIRIRGRDITTVSEHNDVYCDALQELFTRVTGLDTHL